MLLGCMTDEVSTVEVPRDAMPREWVAKADMLGRMCLYAPLLKYELLRNRLAMCELLSYKMKVDLCNELC